MKFTLELDLNELGILYEHHVLNSDDNDRKVLEILGKLDPALKKLCDLTIEKDNLARPLKTKIMEAAMPVVSREKCEYMRNLRSEMRSLVDKAEYEPARVVAMKAMAFLADEVNARACLLDEKAHKLQVEFLNYTLTHIISKREENAGKSNHRADHGNNRGLASDF